MKKTDYCQYAKCKAVAEYKTAFGNLCPYHYKTLKKKKGLKGEKIILTMAEKELLKRFRLMPNFNVTKKEVKKQ
jgi:hypothetical protein